MDDMNCRNVFIDPKVATEYDNYYNTEPGKKIDLIERQLLIPYLEQVSREKLLELGCGTGHWTQFFSDLGFNVIALDASESMLNLAKQKRIPNATFNLANAGNLPFPNGNFPGIISVTMLEFVEDVNKVVTEIFRVLKPGGFLILGCLNELSEIGKNKSQDPVFRHARFFTVEGLEKILKPFGETKFSTGVYISPDFRLLDGTDLQDTVHPAFIAVSVKKFQE